MGLALGKEIKTELLGESRLRRQHVFGNETAKQLFLKKPDEFLLKAQIFYSTNHRCRNPRARPKTGSVRTAR